MIKLPKNFFTNLSLQQYREYLKLLPDLSEEKERLYTMLAFTLIAISFFGIFAINPTLSTITELKRQLADLEFVYQKLITKSQNLSLLQQKYQFLRNDLPMIFEALPQKSEIPNFIAQVNNLLSRSRLGTRSLRTHGVDITPNKKIDNKAVSYFRFSLEAEGAHEDILSFISDMTHINRLVVIENVIIAKDNKRDMLILNLRGRVYFKS